MTLRNLVATSSFALALVFSAPMAAHADTIENINATLVNGGTVTGTITFGLVTIPNNQAGGSATITGYEVTGDNLKVVSNGDMYTFLNLFAAGGTNNQPYSEIFFAPGYSSSFLLDIPGNTPLASLPNGSICTTNSPCASTNYLGVSGGNVFSSFNASVAADSSNVGLGTLSPTPEPSGLVLLGTGILGVARVVRRRFAK